MISELKGKVVFHSEKKTKKFKVRTIETEATAIGISKRSTGIQIKLKSKGLWGRERERGEMP